MRFDCLVIFALAACNFTFTAQTPDPPSPPATELVRLARQQSPGLGLSFFRLCSEAFSHPRAL
jgi:hypothetical protein